MSQNQKAIEVGRFISKEEFDFQIGNYQNEYSDIRNSFIINKDLFLEVLNCSDQLTGIRFMHGLADKKNPQSVKLLLIPCTNFSEYDMASKPLVSNDGYYDHEGNLYSIKEISQLMSNYVQYMVKRNPSLKYKKVIRGNFFGKNLLTELTKESETEFIRYYMGFKESLIKGLMEPLNIEYISSNNVFANFPKPCPHFCPEIDPDAEECLATMASHYHSSEDELNFFRQYRDQELLKLNGGGMLYEMYYFISPLIGGIIHKHENAKSILTKLYFDQIQPFKQMVINGTYQEAAELLEKTLDLMINEYGSSFNRKEKHL